MRRLILLAAALAASSPFPHFRNTASSAGLIDVFPNGGETSKKYIIETTGSGLAFFDYDTDGFPDLFVVSGESAPSRLYRNDGKGRLSDVTPSAVLAHRGWGQGVCAGDYDNDGFTDLFVTYWGQNALYRNRGGQSLENRTKAAGLLQSRVRYNTGCAFLDYDRDGDLDLFVANYVKFDFATTPKPGENPYCWYRNIAVNCGPRGLPFDSNILYKNDGNGRFTDVSASAGIASGQQSYCLGVLTGDFNNDGWTDVFVACDQTPSLLYINQRNGTFSEEALLRGVAFDEHGKALSGMGAASADYDGDGTLDIFRTNFSDERATLYRNRGDGEFDEATSGIGIAHNTRFVGWGCGFLDFDNDGWKDLILVNGHVFPEVDRLKIDIRYKDRAILYRNLTGRRFDDVSESAGSGILEHHSARGLAIADVDNDGSLEVAINNQNETPSLLSNTRKPPGNWIGLKLIGSRSNRSAIGAIVRVTANGRTQIDEVRSGGSYLSQSDMRLHFGVGQASEAGIRVQWPSGGSTVVRKARPNRYLELHEVP